MSNYQTITLQDLLHKPVISITNGEAIAKVVDVKLDPHNLKAALVITSGGGLFQGDMEAIPAENVEVWGGDALLVKQPDVILKESDLHMSDSWLSGANDILGYDVVDQDGTHVGKLSDLVLDTQGNIRGYRMADVYVKGEVAESKWIDVEATYSLGSDVLIIKPLTHPNAD